MVGRLTASVGLDDGIGGGSRCALLASWCHAFCQWCRWVRVRGRGNGFAHRQRGCPQRGCAAFSVLDRNQFPNLAIGASSACCWGSGCGHRKQVSNAELADMLSLPMKLFSLIVLNKSYAICSVKITKIHHMCYFYAIWLGAVWMAVILIPCRACPAG